MLSISVFAATDPRRSARALNLRAVVDPVSSGLHDQRSRMAAENFFKTKNALLFSTAYELPQAPVLSSDIDAFSRGVQRNSLTLSQSFALNKNSTLLISSNFALFANNTGGGGTGPSAMRLEPAVQNRVEDLSSTGCGTRIRGRKAFHVSAFPLLPTFHCLRDSTSDGGRRERRRCPCGAVRPGSISCEGRPTPRCLREFLFSAR